MAKLSRPTRPLAIDHARRERSGLRRLPLTAEEPATNTSGGLYKPVISVVSALGTEWGSRDPGRGRRRGARGGRPTCWPARPGPGRRGGDRVGRWLDQAAPALAIALRCSAGGVSNSSCSAGLASTSSKTRSPAHSTRASQSTARSSRAISVGVSSKAPVATRRAPLSMASTTRVELMWTIASPCGEFRHSAGSCEATARPSQYFGLYERRSPGRRPSGLRKGEPQNLRPTAANDFAHAADLVGIVSPGTGSTWMRGNSPSRLYPTAEPTRSRAASSGWTARQANLAKCPRGRGYQARSHRGRR